MSETNAKRAKRAVVAGTFDPITCGHLEVIKRASRVFDEIIVGVAASTRKGGGPMFSLEERVELATAAVAGLPNVTVKPFTGLLVNFVRECDAGVVVKGLRAVTDFESEFQQSALNFKLDPDIELFFLMSTPEYMYLSSSVVKEIAFYQGSVAGLVPDVVGKALQERTGCEY